MFWKSINMSHPSNSSQEQTASSALTDREKDKDPGVLPQSSRHLVDHVQAAASSVPPVKIECFPEAGGELISSRQSAMEPPSQFSPPFNHQTQVDSRGSIVPETRRHSSQSPCLLGIDAPVYAEPRRRSMPLYESIVKKAASKRGSMPHLSIRRSSRHGSLQDQSPLRLGHHSPPVTISSAGHRGSVDSKLHLSPRDSLLSLARYHGTPFLQVYPTQDPTGLMALLQSHRKSLPAIVMVCHLLIVPFVSQICHPNLEYFGVENTCILYCLSILG